MVLTGRSRCVPERGPSAATSDVGRFVVFETRVDSCGPKFAAARRGRCQTGGARACGLRPAAFYTLLENGLAATPRVAEAGLFHQLLDRGNLDRHERREILVAGLRDEQHVLEPQAEPFVLDAELRLDGEHAAGLEDGGLRAADVVHFHPDRVAESP